LFEGRNFAIPLQQVPWSLHHAKAPVVWLYTTYKEVIGDLAHILSIALPQSSRQWKSVGTNRHIALVSSNFPVLKVM
jgi:hypothetical protein